MTTALQREFPYQPRWTAIVFPASFFSATAVMLGYRAHTNDRGLLINGIIELGQENATVFYEVLAALGVCFVMAACVLAYQRLAFRQRIVLGATAMTLPASRRSRTTQEIAYRDIRRLSVARINRQTFLHVHRRSGKLTIVASMLPSMRAFAELHDILEATYGGRS